MCCFQKAERLLGFKAWGGGNTLKPEMKETVMEEGIQNIFICCIFGGFVVFFLPEHSQ